MNTLMIFTLLALAARCALQRPARAMASGEGPPDPLQEAAEAGDREAMYRLGWALEHGRGIQADPLKAASWYLRAADEGHDQAAAALARVLASDGYRDALFIFEDQEAFDHDLAVAAEAGPRSLARAATSGNELLEGLASEVDATTLFEGVKEGDPEHIFDLALLYEAGVIKTEDPAVTPRWYRRAAVRGVPKAMVSYALFHLRGKADTPQDLAEALRWFKRSAAGGVAEAKFGVWAVRQVSPGLVPLDEAVASLREAADAGVGWAQLAYGQTLKEGRDVPPDVELGGSYLKRGAISDDFARMRKTHKKSSAGAKPGSPKPGSAKKSKGPKRKKRR